MLFIKVFVISLFIMGSISEEINSLDPVMATFQVCDTNADNGLIMEEIKQDGCKEVLQKLFGLSSDMLHDTFFHLDENMDKVISIEEGHAASQSLESSDDVKDVVKDIKETLLEITSKIKNAEGNSNGKPTTTFGNKVLVAGGRKLTTEIIDLKNSSFACASRSRTKFPKRLYNANGGWVGNVPMICGGWSGGTDQKACYVLQEYGAWKEDEEAKLTRGKQNLISGSVVIKDQLVIPEFTKDSTGMGSSKEDYLNFEMLMADRKSKTLQPMNKWGHVDKDSSRQSCIVKWDANTIMLIGANSGGKDTDRRETFFINMGNETRTPGPKLMQGRFHHACNQMTVDGDSFVIVTGGYPHYSTEILSKSSFGKGWQKGPDPPTMLRGHQMVASSDKTKLYTIGNGEAAHDKKIFQFSCEDKSMTKCKWTEILTKLKEGRRYDHVAFPISNELTQKICNLK